MPKFTVRWLEQYELPNIEADTPEDAIELAKDKLSEGDNIECFDFRAIPDED